MQNIKALKELRRVVENAPEDLFDMQAVVEETVHGTVRCALGWCLVDPWFIEHTPLGAFTDWGCRGIGGELNAAVNETFGLTLTDRNRLFGDYPVSRESVLDNIERLLHGEHAVKYDGTPW